jgi:hypothetical protein
VLSIRAARWQKETACRQRTGCQSGDSSRPVSACSSVLLQSIVAKDGVTGVFTRGLATRIAANGLQNICFTVLWNLVRETGAVALLFANETCNGMMVMNRSVVADTRHELMQRWHSILQARCIPTFCLIKLASSKPASSKLLSPKWRQVLNNTVH